MMDASLIRRDGDQHLSPRAYRALAVLAGIIGLAASYVTVRLFALAIQATEQEGAARELLTLAAVLFVSAELAACFIAGLLPVQRLRALRWQLTAFALALVAFEAVSIYGARVALVQAADARAEASTGHAKQLRTSIEASRSSAAALLAAGQKSSQSVIAASRADGAQSIRQATQLETDIRRMTDELAKTEAERRPTTSSVFGESGVIALAVAQSLLVSSIGMVFLGAAGALARAARDARGIATPMHTPASTDAAQTPTAAPVRALMAVEQSQGAPSGTVPAVPGRLHRYALPSLAAGAGLLTCGTAMAASTAPATESTNAPTAEQPLDDRSASDADRFERVRKGIEAGRIKPSLRGIYAAEGASQQVAARYLSDLERAGVIRSFGQGRGYRLNHAPAGA